MKILIGYATKEGQSREIARHVFRRLADQGQAVELLGLKDAEDMDLSAYDAVILAAPIHAGHYPKPLSHFLSVNADQLNALKTLFLSVSLAAHGHDAEEWRSLDEIAGDLASATGWTPNRTLQVAGAYRPSQYDILTGFIMRRIVAKRDPDAKPGEDKVYTDWDQLDADLSDWLPA
ncbi:MAG: flavodoxin domain-containing protein [Henriciella sp.]|nr:flavodoxin domain-containing protein [Henriciella sp.]